MRAHPQPRPDTLFDLKQFYTEVGARIRDARKRCNNMTQKALAMTVGLTRTSLTNIEKGRQKLLLHTFTDIATALGVGVIDLLPQRDNLLGGRKVQLPASLAPEERGFIERTIGVGGSYEIKQATTNRNARPKIAGAKQRYSSTSKR